MLEYTLVRCHGLRARLLPKKAFEGLVEARDLREVVEFLSYTEYRDDLAAFSSLSADELEDLVARREFEEVEEVLRSKPKEVRPSRLDAGVLELAFRKKLVERCLSLLDQAEGWTLDFLRAYCRRFEVQSLIRILRHKVSASPRTEVERSIAFFRALSDLDLDALIEAADVRGAVESLRGTRYEGAIDALRAYERYRSLLPIEARLRSAYYEGVWRLASQLRFRVLRRRDWLELRKILGTEVDVYNCLTCMSASMYGYDEELVKACILPLSLEVRPEALESALSTGEPQTIRELLRPYARVVDRALEGREELAEVEALRYVREEALKAFERATTYAYLVACLFLCEVEYRDLTAIAAGKQFQLRAEELAGELVSLG